MHKIISSGIVFEQFSLFNQQAIKLLQDAGEIYKAELASEMQSEIQLIKVGNFIDISGKEPMAPFNMVKAFKLLSVSGAYWRGNENNKMLQRICGISFPNKSELDKHLSIIEEAKKRDHNKLGRQLELFTTAEEIGQGLPLLMPKGAKIIQILQRFIEDEEEKRGYQFTKTPFMAKSDLYKISGHWQHYKDGMFVLGDEEKDQEVLALRPMTCPFQFMIYKSKQRSYRDLPIRYAETSTLFRNEASGEMHGLIRVRQFTISEGHIICTPEQLEFEFRSVIDLINFVMQTLGIQNDISYRFSKWDPSDKEKYIDNPEAWEDTQTKMKNILDHLEIPYDEIEGEAAFYGPKLDIQFRNVHGKEDTIITVQIDFALPERFDMYYIGNNHEKKRPYVIHRTSIGCYERTLAMLIEKYAGAFPAWLCPIQVKILPVSEKHIEYARQLSGLLMNGNIRCEVDIQDAKLGYKIRNAQLEKAPYMLIVGDQEVEADMVSVRARSGENLGSMSVESFIDLIRKDLKQ